MKQKINVGDLVYELQQDRLAISIWNEKKGECTIISAWKGYQVLTSINREDPNYPIISKGEFRIE